MESIASMTMEGTALERNSWSESLAFAGRALVSPRRFGAILPSGPEPCRALARAGKGRTLVELGPGTGSITRHLLRGLPMDGRILALELDPGIACILQKSLPDPRLQVRIGDAGDWTKPLTAAGVTGVRHARSPDKACGSC